MECSVSIDKLGRECIQRRKYLYKYKDKVDIVALAMVDDLLGIAPCGLESLALNTFINVQIEIKNLNFTLLDLMEKPSVIKYTLEGKMNFAQHF